MNYFHVINVIKVDSSIPVGVKVKDQLTGKIYNIKCRFIVNATGIFTDLIQSKLNLSHEITNYLYKQEFLSLAFDHNQVKNSHSFNTFEHDDKKYKTAFLIPKSEHGEEVLLMNYKNLIIANSYQAKDIKLEEPQDFNVPKEQIKSMMGQINSVFNYDKIHILSKWVLLKKLDRFQNYPKISLIDEIVYFDSPNKMYTIIGGNWLSFKKKGDHIANEILTQLYDSKLISKNEYKERLENKIPKLIGRIRSDDMNLNNKNMTFVEYNEIGLKMLENMFPLISKNLIQNLYSNYGMRAQMILREIIFF